MTIKKLVLTESDGSTEDVAVSSALTNIVATMDDDSVVTLFPTTAPGPVETIAIPLNTPIQFVERT